MAENWVISGETDDAAPKVGTVLTKKVNINADALQVIGRMEWEENGVVIGRIVDGQLDRKLYEEVAKGLAALGGKWNRGKGGHIFQIDPRPEIDSLLGNGFIEVERDGFFETPTAVIEQMLMQLTEPVRAPILEPSAGLGAIIKHMVSEEWATYKDFRVCEKNTNRLMKLQDLGVWTVGYGDFLEYFPKNHRYPLILMNPPFEAGQDIDHITHAFTHCLASGGELVSVASEGPFFRSGEKAIAFRALVEQYGYSLKLADDSFKESGTGVSARLVYLSK